MFYRLLTGGSRSRKTAGRDPRRARGLQSERLEDRCLLAADSVFINDNWHLWQDLDGSGSLTVGDLVRNDNDPLSAGTISATYGVDGFGELTSGLTAAQLPASLPAFSELQQAIDGTSVGGTLHVLPGVYSPASTLIVDRPLTMSGPQAGIDPRFERYYGDATEAVISGAAGGLPTVLRIAADDVRIEGLELTHAAGSGGSGDLIESLDGADVARTTIRYNLIHYAGDDAIQLRDVFQPRVERNRIFTTGGDAITLTRTTGAVVEDNHVFDIYSSDGAIYAFGSTDTTIRGNWANDIYNNDGIKIGSNTGADAARRGGAILNNIVFDVFNGGDGIAVYSSDVEVRGNEVFNTRSIHGAISVRFAVDNVVIAENYVHDNSNPPSPAAQTAGIKIGRVNAYPIFVAIKDNRIQNNDVGILVDGSTALIENNVLTGNQVGVRIQGGSLVDLGSLDDPDDGDANPTGRSAGSDLDGSSDGRNVLAGYRGLNGNYAIENLNLLAEGHPHVWAEGNRFGTLDVAQIQPLVYDSGDDAALTAIDTDPPGGSLIIMDNGEPGYDETGEWLDAAGGFKAGQRVSAAGDGESVAGWTFSGLPLGVYRVWATWTPAANAAEDAPFRVLDDSQVLQAVRVDQTADPDDFTEDQLAWEDLGGHYEIVSGTLTVLLSDDAAGAVIADAIRVERVSDLGNPGWQNPVNPWDVTGEGLVTALDVLVLINAINRLGAGLLPLPAPAPQLPPPYLDVDGDGLLTPADVLSVINRVNEQAGSAEGEPWWPADLAPRDGLPLPAPSPPSSSVPLAAAADEDRWRAAAGLRSPDPPASPPTGPGDAGLNEDLGWQELLDELAIAIARRV